MSSNLLIYYISLNSVCFFLDVLGVEYVPPSVNCYSAGYFLIPIHLIFFSVLYPGALRSMIIKERRRLPLQYIMHWNKTSFWIIMKTVLQWEINQSNKQACSLIRYLRVSTSVVGIKVYMWLPASIVILTASNRTGILTDLVKIPFLRWCQSVKLSKNETNWHHQFLAYIYYVHIYLM